ncbi:MAG: EAL domain-containing protein [Desulfobulbaceae bacterium]|nr:MAG: EAL domain-containing protein [Desulfobulbaceae bacterium]
MTEDRAGVDMERRSGSTICGDLMESLPDALMVIDDRQRILSVNMQLEVLFGCRREEVVERPVEMLIPEPLVVCADRSEGYLLRVLRAHPGPLRRDTFAVRCDGSEFPVEIHLGVLEREEGAVLVVTIHDISERKRSEAFLQHEAFHDALTGLPNRHLLEDRISQALLQAERAPQQFAILAVDLDRFKLIQAELSLEMGDEILHEIAGRLKTSVRENDTVARVADDVFALVLTNLHDGKDAAKVAKKIQEAVSRPIAMAERVLEITCSIGISLYPKDGRDVQTLLKNAHIATFRAKEKGQGHFLYFTDSLNELIVARSTMERHLRQAIENRELAVHYQPQMDLRTGRMVGCEALLRWRNPELGNISPGVFIPLAEETGLIIPIGEWVLETACRDNRRWQRAGYPQLTVAVNISPRQFWEPGLVRTITRVLASSGLDPQFLELEITEGMVMRDVENVMAMLGELKELGVRLSIDDFGTGYSSLSHLKRFPFDKLKMDISFVRDVTHDPGCAAIARTIIAMAHNLNLRVIAEGIETEGQLSYLRLRGCDEMQGFCFSPALAGSDFERVLAEGRMLQFPSLSEGQPKRSMLLVDDEPRIITVIERVLRVDGYRIFTATRADEGFEILATNQIGVVLSDLRMPGMDGIEFLSRVSRLHPETVRIAMSGYADMDMVTGSINRGAIYKFLTKPFENEVLRQNIAKAFEQFEKLNPGDR